MTEKQFIETSNGEVLKIGEIWWYNDSQTSLGTGKVRPCVIRKITQITNNHAVIRIVPFTRWRFNFKNKHELIKVYPNESNGLRKVSALDLCQEQPVKLCVFTSRLGELCEDVFKQRLEVLVL